MNSQSNRLKIIWILALSLLTTPLAQAEERPPQFVMLAYDGSKDNSMWQRTSDWGKEVQARLTYFVSGVYFLTNANRRQYRPPAGRPAGASDIGFGGLSSDLELRLNNVIQAKMAGHELASHANGHFDGSRWSINSWAQEFSEFNRLLINVHQNNQLPMADAPAWQNHLKDSFTGFRAPLLGTSPGLWETLQKNQFSYDTSRVGSSTAWPSRTNYGFWNFPLAILTIAGTAKKTLSMDYNFYYADSGASPDPANSKIYEERMLKTYMNYFRQNYNGNRAPLHIGHHFSKWNAGAYLRALERFGKSVCTLPEVKCVTYQELARFMDQQSPATLARWQSGDFAKTEPLPMAETGSETKDISLKIQKAGSEKILVTVSGADAAELLRQDHQFKVRINDKNDPAGIIITKSREGALIQFRQPIAKSRFVLSVGLVDSENIEVQRAAHWVAPGISGFTISPADLDEQMRLTADPIEAHQD